MRRPLTFFGYTALFTLLFVVTTGQRVLVGFFAVVCLAISAALYYKKRTAMPLTTLVMACGAVFALFYITIFDVVMLGDYSTQQRITGVITDVSGTVYGESVATVEVTEATDLPPRAKLTVGSFGGGQIGDVITCDVLLTDSSDDHNYSDGVFFTSTLNSDVTVQRSGVGISYLFSGARRALTERLSPYLSAEALGVAAAMVYGDREAMPWDLYFDFRLAGLSHILVVSGLHLSILSDMLLILLKHFFKNRFIIYPAIILVVVLYTLLCGMKLSIVRAAFVVILLCLAQLVGRRQDAYTSLSVAVLCLIISNPYVSVDLSLLLSFTATFGILYGNETFPIGKKLKKLHISGIVGAALTTLCATVATMPIFAALGGGFSLLAIPANVASFFLATPIIALVLIGLLTSVLPFASLTATVLTVAEFFIDLLIAVARFVADLPWQFVNFYGMFPLVLLLAAFAGGFIVHLKFPGKAAVAAGTFIAVCGIAVYIVVNVGTVQVAVIGDTKNPVIVVTQGFEAAVIYRGTKSNNLAVTDYLQNRNIRNIEQIVDITHSDDSSLTLTAEDAYSFYDSGYYNDRLYLLDKYPLHLSRQSDGNAAILSVGGFNIATASGTTDISQFGEQSLVVSGTSQLHGIDTDMLFARKHDACIDCSASHLLSPDDNPVFSIRPYTSIMVNTLY